MDISTIINQTPDNLLKAITERVKRKRLDRNLTQRAFAKKVFVAEIDYLGYDKHKNL